MESTSQNKEKNRIQLNIGILVLGGLILFIELFWNSGLSVLFLTKPQLNYAVARSLQSISGVFVDFLILLFGYQLGKNGKTNFKLLLRQWGTLLLIGVVVFIFQGLIFQKATLSNFYDVFLPILRNASPLVTGIFLGELFIPAIRKIAEEFSARKTFLFLFVLGLIPTVFNTNFLGFADGNSALFSFYLFILGTVYSFVEQKLFRKPVKWLIIAMVVTIVLNFIMMSISYGRAYNLNSAGRFSVSSSALIILASVCLLDCLGLNNKKRTLFVGKQYRLSDNNTYYLTSILLLASPKIIYNFNQINSKFGFSRIREKLMITLFEAIIVALVLYLLAIIFSISFEKIRLGQEYSKVNLTNAWKILQRKAHAFLKSRSFLTLVVVYMLAVFSMLMMNNSFIVKPSVRLTINIFSFTFFIREATVFLNMLIILALFAILRLVFMGRYWGPFIILNMFVVIWTIASRIKQDLRQEPTLPSDLPEIKNFSSLLGMVSTPLIVLTAVGIVLCISLIIYLEIKHAGQKLKRWKILTYSMMSVLFLSFVFTINHNNAMPAYFFNLLGDQRYFQNQMNGSRANGSILQFLNNVDVKIMNQPKGYSKDKMAKIYDKYSKVQKQINQGRKNNIADQTVVMVLSESFSDIQRIPGVKLNHDPMPYIRSLKNNTTSGSMISAGYGGGTGNMEFMALTGFGLGDFSKTLRTPYTQLVGGMKTAPSVVNNFKHGIVIHPYQGTYYNRNSVYNKFGFDHFYNLDNKKYPIKHQRKIDNNNYLSDYTAYENTIDQIKNRKKGQFIHLVTMQNHFPYNVNTYKDRGFRASGNTILDRSNQINIEQYATGMKYTDQYTKNFINQLDQIQKPITLIFYGDHLPANYPGLSVNEHNLTLHETDYFIYSNKYARNHGYGVKKMVDKNTQIVSPTRFFPLALEQSSSKVNPYNALLTKVSHELPVYESNNFDVQKQFIINQNKMIKESNLTQKQKTLLHDYRLVQYDMTAGNQYLQKTSFFKRVSD